MILSQLDGAISALAEQSDVPARKALAASAMGLFDVTIGATTLTKPSLSLAAKLFGLAVKSDGAEKGQLKAAAAHVARRAASLGGAHKELSARMQALLPGGKK